MNIKSNYVDIENRKIFPCEITIEDKKIKSIKKINQKCENYILPGFIDAHIHIESSMLPPSEFARLAVIHGTVATVSDPHEIANVLGIRGVEFMIENSKSTNFKIFFGASPCVPATLFETSGAVLGVKEIKELLEKKEIKYLSEVMNFPGVINGDKEIIAKIKVAKEMRKPIDGHAPGLRGEALTKYINAGISTDHESFSYDEAKEKLEKGMKIIIREGSAAKNFEALHPLIDEYYEKMMFCSDDRHPDDLKKGHINDLVKRAVKYKHDVFNVLQMACINPIRHYNLEVGMLREGDFADFIIVKDLENFEILQTWINGEMVAKEGKTLLSSKKYEILNNFNTSLKKEEDFYLPECNTKRVIEVVDKELITHKKELKKDKDILKIAVINRYKDAPVKGLGYIKGFGLKEGAIASSVAHDSHNVVVVGCDDYSIMKAANTIIKNKGGICAYTKEKTLFLNLDIAGLMSSKDGFKVAEKYEEINNFVKNELNSPLTSPFMTLSFMALLVIPELKVSDKGLFDVTKFDFTDVCVD